MDVNDTATVAPRIDRIGTGTQQRDGATTAGVPYQQQLLHHTGRWQCDEGSDSQQQRRPSRRKARNQHEGHASCRERQGVRQRGRGGQQGCDPERGRCAARSCEQQPKSGGTIGITAYIFRHEQTVTLARRRAMPYRGGWLPLIGAGVLTHLRA